MKTLLVLSLLAVAGCASTSDVDLSKAEPACGQSCSMTYSQCVSKFTFFPIHAQNVCTDSLRMCAQTCPTRK